MIDAPVLVITAVDDITADLVIRRLYDRAVPVVRLDPADFLGGVATMSARFGREMSGVIRTTSRELDLGRVRAVWWRRPTPYQVPAGLDEHISRFTVNEAGMGFTGVLAALDSLWVYHPWDIRAADHKPVQLNAAVDCGFRIPETLITNDLQQAHVFVQAFESVVYKPLRQGPLPSEDGRLGTIWVGPVSADDLNEAVADTAHTFQARVPKVADVRVTVVDQRIFAVRIDSGGLLDWRSDYSALDYSLVPCPVEVERAIHSYMTRFRLLFGAFDFALTLSGEWIFLECNPNGQWAWIEKQEDAVADALADLLAKGKG
ncbi:ATP-grasp ribosomal peptide maturase [Sphaerisporangium sp. NPDC051017]|uniref:ATP-grasp ribosomal peptide maturase n=1 Tax=Sphaerisporangium sp. NPDC051017 TaxID=3154636 RepID=UPI00343A4352